MFTVQQRVKMLIPDTLGGGTKYGKIDTIVNDMFDGTDLYLVDVGGVVKTYKE